MKSIKYTPDAADKLRKLNDYISKEYGKVKAKKIIKSITDAINDLKDHERKSLLVSNMFEVDTDCRYIFASRNYVFYRIEEHSICIINIYNEKEDFIQQLFGINTTSQETIDYWGE